MLPIALRSLQIGSVYADRLSTVVRPAPGFWHRDAGIVGVNARQHSRLTVSWSYWPVATVPYKPQILMILCSGHSTKPSPRGHCALRFQSRLISEAGRRNAASKSRVGACNASPRKWKSCSNVAANPSSSGPRGSESPTLAGPLDGSRPAWRVQGGEVRFALTFG